MIFFIFLVFSYISAFIFENFPRFIFIELLNANERYLWEEPGWPWFMLIWYALIFSIAYFIAFKKSVKYAIVAGIIIGTLAETFLFKKMNIISFFLFPILYGGMFYMPFKVLEWVKRKWKK